MSFLKYLSEMSPSLHLYGQGRGMKKEEDKFVVISQGRLGPSNTFDVDEFVTPYIDNDAFFGYGFKYTPPVGDEKTGLVTSVYNQGRSEKEPDSYNINPGNVHELYFKKMFQERDVKVTLYADTGQFIIELKRF